MKDPTGCEANPSDVIAALLTQEAPNTRLATPLANVLEERAEIMRLSQASHDAVLHPAEPGGLSYAERAAFATRIAHLNGDARLAAHYLDLLAAAVPSAPVRACTDPTHTESLGAWLDPLRRHVDLLTRQPSAATQDDVEALRRAGIADADIVRLVELIAFVNYQARVVAGLKLLQVAR